jgi:hypothetical protein
MMAVRALAAPLNLDWRQVMNAVLIGVGVAANFAFLAGYAIWVMERGGHPFDYPIFSEATTRLTDGALYQWDTHGYIYPYSPVFAWLFVPFAWAGIYAWWALHFVCVAVIPSWPWRIAILLSAGFWMDTYEGNVTAFFMLAGYWMVRGNRRAGWAFIVGTLLVPKPQFVIGCAWLAWRHPEYRRPLLWIVPLYALLVLATGYGLEWLGAIGGAGHDVENPFQFLPSRLIGPWWLAIGLPLATLLAWRGHPGCAGIIGSLYAGPPQLLLLVIEKDWNWLSVGRRGVPRPSERALSRFEQQSDARGTWNHWGRRILQAFPRWSRPMGNG